MDPVSVHADLVVPLRFAVGVAAALAALFAMDAAMARLPEGETSPAVAAGVLTDTRPGAASGRLAAAVHYIAGGLTGPFFVWLLFAAEGLLGAGPAATAAAAAVCYVLMVGFFAGVVLPRSAVEAGRVRAIVRDWAVVAAVYLAVLVPVVHVGSGLL